MIYKDQLELLADDCVQKANAYIEAVIVKGQYDTYSNTLQKEWEKAEGYYASCLDLIKSQEVKLDDDIPGPSAVV